MAAFADERWRERLAGKEETLQLTDDGKQGDEIAQDGVFSRTLLTPSIPGHYDLVFHLQGHAADGQPFERRETFSIFVGIGGIDPGRSRVRTIDLQGSAFFEISPADAAGQPPGAGVRLPSSSWRSAAKPCRSRIGSTGSYRAALPPGLPPEEPVLIAFDGETVKSTDRGKETR